MIKFAPCVLMKNISIIFTTDIQDVKNVMSKGAQNVTMIREIKYRFNKEKL